MLKPKSHIDEQIIKNAAIVFFFPNKKLIKKISNKSDDEQHIILEINICYLLFIHNNILTYKIVTKIIRGVNPNKKYKFFISNKKFFLYEQQQKIIRPKSSQENMGHIKKIYGINKNWLGMGSITHYNPTNLDFPYDLKKLIGGTIGEINISNGSNCFRMNYNSNNNSIINVRIGTPCRTDPVVTYTAADRKINTINEYIDAEEADALYRNILYTFPGTHLPLSFTFIIQTSITFITTTFTNRISNKYKK